MKRLEAVYIANVILYIEPVETIIKLIRVNKKCQEATKIIRYYNKRKLCESDDESDYYGIVNNIFDIFPNIETIRCREKDILNNLELFDKVKQIELFDDYHISIKLPQKLKDKIIKLKIFNFTLKDIRLNEFPNVKKVKINCFSLEGLKIFLGDNDVVLNQLVIETEYKSELETLKEYKNIENKMIKLKKKITKERYQELKQFATVYSEYPIDGIDIKDSFCLSYYFKVSNKYDINRLYDLTLFTRCFLESECDLRKCEFLEEIIVNYFCNTDSVIQVEGLKHLKRIENISKVDCIPSNVSYLSFKSSFDCNELLEKDNECFKNIKEVQIKIDNSENTENPKILMNFENCAKLELMVIDDGDGQCFGIILESAQTFEIPMSVKELIIGNNVNKNEIKEIGKITGLKKLEINFSVKNNSEEINEMFDKLKELEWLKTNYFDGILLPLSLTCLELKVKNNTDLSQYTNLKEISMYCPSSGNKEVKIPNKLNKLYIYGDIKVINSNEIEVGRIIFNNTPSQFCEWNSKNIFVLKRYELKNDYLL